MENDLRNRLLHKNTDFEPKILGLWNFRFADSGTGTSVYRADSLLGERAVKFFNLEGSENVNKVMVQNYQRSVSGVSRWMKELRTDLREEQYKEDSKTARFDWEVNPVQTVGEQNFNAKKVPYTVSLWLNGFPLSDVFEGKSFPKELETLDKAKLVIWLRERVDLKRRQYAMVNPYYLTKDFIPVYRNFLIVPGPKDVHKLVVVDIRDYLDPRRNPIKNLARFRATGR